MGKKQNILFYTIGPRIMSSSRARVYIYEEVLKREGLDYKIIPAINTYFCDKRIRGKHKSLFVKPFYVADILLHLFLFFVHIPFYRFVVVQKVMFPTSLVSLLRVLFTNRTCYIDVDDLIYNPQEGEKWSKEKTERMKNRFRINLELYSAVITSTDFIKNELFKDFPSSNKSIMVINDPVNTASFHPKHYGNRYARPVIGWIGTPSNTHYLLKPLECLERIHKNGVKFTLFLSGSDSDLIRNQNYSFPIVFEEWLLSHENDQYDTIDIGLMPLSDDDWSRAKGGYKLLHYMAMEKIAVASAVGINCSIIENGKNGFLIYDDTEWFDTLLYVIQNYLDLNILREEARRKITSDFALNRIGDSYVNLFNGNQARSHTH